MTSKLIAERTIHDGRSNVQAYAVLARIDGGNSYRVSLVFSPQRGEDMALDLYPFSLSELPLIMANSESLLFQAYLLLGPRRRRIRKSRYN